MTKRVYILRLIWVGLLLVSAAGNVYATRIYGGHYSEERITNLRNNCRKYEWAKQQLNAAVEKAKPWLARTDEALWMMVPGQDLPRTIDVAYDKFAAGPKFVGCIVCGDKIFK